MLAILRGRKQNHNSLMATFVIGVNSPLRTKLLRLGTILLAYIRDRMIGFCSHSRYDFSCLR